MRAVEDRERTSQSQFHKRVKAERDLRSRTSRCRTNTIHAHFASGVLRALWCWVFISPFSLVVERWRMWQMLTVPQASESRKRSPLSHFTVLHQHYSCSFCIRGAPRPMVLGFHISLLACRREMANVADAHGTPSE